MWLYYHNIKVRNVQPDALLNKRTGHKDHSHRCVNVYCCVVLVIAPVSFLYSCLSLEAETWRKTESPALSATDKYCVSDRYTHTHTHTHIYIYMCVCVVNQETGGNGIKCRKFWFVTEDIGLCVMCESPGSVNLWLVCKIFLIMGIL